jgi:hypothetical protein
MHPHDRDHRDHENQSDQQNGEWPEVQSLTGGLG